VYSATGQPVGLLSSDEEAMIELAVDVDHGPASLRCFLGLVTSTVRLQVAQPNKFEVREAGRRYVSVRVPPGSLPAGSFRGRVTVFSFTDLGRELVHQRHDAFSIEVLEPRGKRGDTGATGTRGASKRNLSLAWGVSER
jgi:hypothetical protein